jgi:uridine phosphorylase
MDLPILENDLADDGVLDPARLYAATGAPRRAVMCFFQEVVEKFGRRQHAVMGSAYGGRPMYETEREGEAVAFFFPGVGAPAAASSLEEAIVMGCRDFVIVGGAGALVPELTLGHAVVVDSAVRDEGTSFHYLQPSRTVAADPAATAAIVSALDSARLPFVTGRTWTTDAIFRETRARAERRIAERCVTVEMEAAASFAVGAFRGARMGQLLYAGDSLVEEEWDSRDWLNATTVREQLFEVALSAAARMNEL